MISRQHFDSSSDPVSTTHASHFSIQRIVRAEDDDNNQIDQKKSAGWHLCFKCFIIGSLLAGIVSTTLTTISTTSATTSTSTSTAPPCSTACCTGGTGPTTCTACIDTAHSNVNAVCRYANPISDVSHVAGHSANGDGDYGNFLNNPGPGYFIYDTNGRYSGNANASIPCTTDYTAGDNNYLSSNADYTYGC
ncbi:unnamed protein product [Adineta steineri]|uniref:Uncharacterized protein n=1 Tax=Adineta steineri TaxID=433720 RepID=A0A819C318_9BILA|nr:unnamed protein product [Adineta steineri]CAF3934616.1 unnamed protein product [Adineta steineri]